MDHSTTSEITITMSRKEYRAQLTQAVRELASAIATKEDDAELDHEEELGLWVTEYLTEEGGAYLAHPVSVIEHAEATLSHRGASRLGEVTSTEDFAQEHARDLFKQDITTHLKEVLDGESVEDVVFSNPQETTEEIPTSSIGQENDDGYVMITPETATCAVEELNLYLNYADNEMDTSAAEDALDELQRAIKADTPRTRVCRANNMEEVVMPGVKRGTLKIDYLPETPILTLHTPDNCVIEPVIHLPSEEVNTESTEEISSAEGGGA